jgi:hypothetical protein
MQEMFYEVAPVDTWAIVGNSYQLANRVLSVFK